VLHVLGAKKNVRHMCCVLLVHEKCVMYAGGCAALEMLEGMVHCAALYAGGCGG